MHTNTATRLALPGFFAALSPAPTARAFRPGRVAFLAASQTIARASVASWALARRGSAGRPAVRFSAAFVQARATRTG